MTNTEAKRRLLAGEVEVIEALPLKQLYVLAEKLGADTQLAKRLRGIGFQHQELERAIRTVIEKKND